MSFDKGGVGLWGLGVALPPHVRNNAFWDGLIASGDPAQRNKDVLAVERSAGGKPSRLPDEVAAAMARFSGDVFRGARTRRVLADGVDSSDLEAEAGKAALEDAAVSAEEIDLVLVHSLLPDRLIPSNAPAVQAKLGLHRAAAWSLDAGCASFQAHLVSAAALVRQGVFRRVLVVQSHVGTRAVDLGHPQSTNFGDAAAAAVVGEVPEGYGLLGHYARTDGSFRDGIVLAPVVEGRPVHEWWGAHGGASQLASFDTDRGKTAGQRAGEFCREACFGALRAAGLELDDVALYVGNQSLGWFVDACRRALELEESRVLETFADYANVGDAAIVLNLSVARQRGRLTDGDILLLYSPAAGFTLSAVVYRWWQRNI